MKLILLFFLSATIFASTAVEICELRATTWQQVNPNTRKGGCMHAQFDSDRLVLQMPKGVLLVSDPEKTYTYQPGELLTIYDTRSMHYLKRFKRFLQNIAVSKRPYDCSRVDSRGIYQCSLQLFGNDAELIQFSEKKPQVLRTLEHVSYQIPNRFWSYSLVNRSLPWTYKWPKDIEVLDMRKKESNHA